jgi:hypothetical protein
MNTRRWRLLWIVAVILAGCVSPAEQKGADEAQCRGYGYTDGTDAFANCMMTTARSAAQVGRGADEKLRSEPAEAADASSARSESTRGTYQGELHVHRDDVDRRQHDHNPYLDELLVALTVQCFPR